jgi:hypothetical protein
LGGSNRPLGLATAEITTSSSCNGQTTLQNSNY